MIYLFRKVLGRREDQRKGIWDGDGMIMIMREEGWSLFN